LIKSKGQDGLVDYFLKAIPYRIGYKVWERVDPELVRGLGPGDIDEFYDLFLAEVSRYVDRARSNVDIETIFRSRRPDDTAYKIKGDGDYDRGVKPVYAGKRSFHKGSNVYKPRDHRVSHITRDVQEDEDSDDSDEGYDDGGETKESAPDAPEADQEDQDGTDDDADQDMMLLGKSSTWTLADKKKMACIAEVKGVCKYGPAKCQYSHDEALLKAKCKEMADIAKNSKYGNSLRVMQSDKGDKVVPRTILTKKLN
jgi:hypothetical protein